MLVLGIDPGCRNFGIAVVNEKKEVLYLTSGRTAQGGWQESYYDILDLIHNLTYDKVVIENVGWYGRRQGMYALNRLVGALWAYCKTETYLPMPNRKVKLSRKLKRLTKNEHEADAIALALCGIERWVQKTKNKKAVS